MMTSYNFITRSNCTKSLWCSRLSRHSKTLVDDVKQILVVGESAASILFNEKSKAGIKNSKKIARALGLCSLSINEVSTLAGSGAPGYKDGDVAIALFNEPTGLSINSDGSVFIIDSENHCIRELTSEGVVSTLAGNGVAGYKDGQGERALFNFSLGGGMAVSGHGDIFIADGSNDRIRRISKDGKVSTFAGSGVEGFLDGPAENARFNGPLGVYVDEDDNLFVADCYNHRIRTISRDGIVSTLAGSGLDGFQDGRGSDADFNCPIFIHGDKNCNLYVSDFKNHRIRKISKEGVVSTLAGKGYPGQASGQGNSACIEKPGGIAIDGDGNVILADSGNNRILEITPEGNVSTIAGSGNVGFKNGPGLKACLYCPSDLIVDACGNIVFCEIDNHCIRTVAASRSPPLTFQFLPSMKKTST